VLLKLSLWKDVEEYLSRRDDVVVPLGSTEQHGPSGPLGTDLIVAEELANELSGDARCAVAPAIPFGASQLHSAFPGTVTLRPMTYLALVRDAVTGLWAQGFRRFLLINAHPGSAGLLASAAEQLDGELPGARCLVFNWWEPKEVRGSLADLFGAREGLHATPGELSLVRKFYPRGVLDLPPIPVFESRPPPHAYGPADFRARFPDGKVGSDPALATAAAGDRLFVAVSRALADAHRQLLEPAAPAAG
jgi:creatinine amidohydrolase